MIALSSFSPTPEMISIIADIDAFKDSWKNPNDLPITIVENIASSARIEGVHLSEQTVEELLSNLDSRSSLSPEEEEIAWYALVCQEIFNPSFKFDFCEETLKQLHERLLKFSTKNPQHHGQYKTFPNDIENGINFTSPENTPGAMQQLISWANAQLETKSIHPLILIGIFTIRFLMIHPFQEENGRLSRILITLMLLNFGYSYSQYSSLDRIIENNQESYYFALQQASNNSDFKPWVTFFLKSLQEQKEKLSVHISHKNDHSLDDDLSLLAIKILELLNEHKSLSLNHFETLTNANKHTLKKHLSNLTKREYILQKGKGKATYYCIHPSRQSK